MKGSGRVEAELIFLLNNDTVVEPDCFRELDDAAAAHPQISFFATKMVFRIASGSSIRLEIVLEQTGKGET